MTAWWAVSQCACVYICLRCSALLLLLRFLCYADPPAVTVAALAGSLLTVIRSRTPLPFRGGMLLMGTTGQERERDE